MIRLRSVHPRDESGSNMEVGWQRELGVERMVGRYWSVYTVVECTLNCNSEDVDLKLELQCRV